MIKKIQEQIYAEVAVTREQALALVDTPLEALCQAADEIRLHFCGTAFSFCTIVNGKCGRCSENCKFCAQSAHFPTDLNAFELKTSADMLTEVVYNVQRGVNRVGLVTSGKALPQKELEGLLPDLPGMLSDSGARLCASFGLLDEAGFRRLKAAGIDRIHNNLETSRRFFPEICTTHTYDEKIQTIGHALAAGLTVCSGGIFGLGETMADRIDMALELRQLGITSVPLNMLNPIPGTPFGKNPLLTEDEMRRTVSLYRFILPKATIRLAGGRGLMPDGGRKLFQSGANGAITGDMLTTTGTTIASDRRMIADLGFEYAGSGEI